MTQEPGDNNLEIIAAAAMRLVEEIDDKNVVPQERRLWLAHGVTDLILAAVTKFIRGQEEHGDNFEEVHGPSEALQEFVDTFWYLRKCTHPITLYTKEQND